MSEPSFATSLKNTNLLNFFFKIKNFRNFILTAAHCGCDGGYVASDFRVTVGEHVFNLLSGREQFPTVSKIHMHPLYVDGLDYDYDFCLLELANPIQFNQYVQPVCLPLSCDDECPEEAEMISAGWGDRNGNTIAIAISPLPLPIAAIALQYSPPYKRADCLMCLGTCVPNCTPTMGQQSTTI